MSRALKFLAAMFVASLAFAAVAVAHTVKYDVAVQAKFKQGGKDAGAFSGTVESSSVRCTSGREVKIFLRNSSPPDTEVGSDVTDTAGAWEFIPASTLAPGAYYAVVSKTVLKKNTKHRHVCKRGQSADVTVK